MHIRLISDIHFELSRNGLKLINKFIPKFTDIEQSSEEKVLILAGDIGDPTSKLYKTFITKMSRQYDQVFIVTGNHEYYQSYTKKYDSNVEKLSSFTRYSIENIDTIIKLVATSLPNVHFLQRDSFIYNGIRFLGCTLWTKSDPKIAVYMNDYSNIVDMTPNRCEELHDTDIKWLEEELNKEESSEYKHTVVITHHLPTYKLIADKYVNHPMNSLFASDLDYLVEKANIWCCGHSHMAKHVTVGKCRCYLNPVGYSLENTGFNSDMSIMIS